MSEGSRNARRAVEAAALAVMFLALGVGLVVYGARDWMPPLASRHGAGIDAMLTYLLVTTGTLALIGFLTLALFVWRGGRRTRALRAATTRTEMIVSLSIGVLMALVAEGGVLSIGLPVWQEYFGGGAAVDAITVDVVAQQFFWNVRYPGPDGTFGRTRVDLVDEATNAIGLDRTDPAAKDDIQLVNLIVGVVGRPMHVQLRSKDMIHSFFLPHLRVKQDAVPGMTPEITFTPTRTGSFELACAELCGLGHYRMQGLFTVVEARDFDGVLAEASK